MTVLKIDQDARREKRRAELSRIMREAVWGDESVRSMPIHKIAGAVIAWHSFNGTDDAICAAFETIAEAASLGVIRMVGRYWRPDARAPGPR